MGRWIERNFMLIAFVLCAAAMFRPAAFVWSKSGISFLLGVIMFGMGITLRPENFREVLRRKRLVAVGAAAQFVCMQNSGLGVALATRLFSSMPLAALPGALFSLWHNLSGIAVADWWQRRSE